MAQTNITSTFFETPRLRTHCLLAGDPTAVPLVLVHGNVSCGDMFREVVPALAEHYFVLVPDLRGYGDSEIKPLDATRGVRDLSDDLYEAMEAAGAFKYHTKAHWVGWSVGGNVVMQYALDHGAQVGSMVLLNPGSPYGFGGTKGTQGTPCFDDYAGSGGGLVNANFVQALKAGDRGDDTPVKPLAILRKFYVHPPFRSPAEVEQRYLDDILKTAVGDANYPGGVLPSSNWPTLAPGTQGINNAMSPKYLDQSGLADIGDKPPVLWIRGANDRIVSDHSMFCAGELGRLGAMPGWPGEDVFPPQPMVAQTRAVLDDYQAKGGTYREVVFEACGHSPHIEKQALFLQTVREFLGTVVPG